MIEEPKSPSISDVLPAALILSVAGWGGLAYLIFFTLPTLGPRWLFFFLSVLAATGFALPLMAFLNRRFPSQPPVTMGVVVREALWVGIYFPTLAWLKIGRVLIPSLAVLLAVGLVIIETLLRLREKSQWKPW